MAIRKILVPVDGSESARTALNTALVVGRAHGAHVEALHVRLSPTDAVPMIGEGMSGAFAEELMELTAREAEVRAAAARQVFDACRRDLEVPQSEAPLGGDVTTALVEVVGREDEETARRGRLADLVVVARPSAGSDVTADLTLNAALYGSGRPVLVAPAEPRPVIGRRIALAWNNSVEAARMGRHRGRQRRCGGRVPGGGRVPALPRHRRRDAGGHGQARRRRGAHRRLRRCRPRRHGSLYAQPAARVDFGWHHPLYAGRIDVAAANGALTLAAVARAWRVFRSWQGIGS
jgi:nucleotide-binding universal stress UspA family protein